MNFKTLKQFLALAETLHFGRASDECYISISALSRNIRHLEEELGVSLFNRDNRTVVLTQEGQKFLKYARDASRQWHLIRHELTDNPDQLSGEISLYGSVTASYSFLHELLRRFRIAYPVIEIKLRTGDPEHAIAHVLDGKEDLSIAAQPAHLPRGLAFKPIATSPLLFIAPLEQQVPNVPINTPITPAEWANIPMILSESGVSRARVDEWFRQLDVSPRIYAQVTGNEAIVSMVSLGFGIGVVPKIVLDNSPLVDRIRVLDVTPELEPYDIGLFTLKKNLKNPLVDAFWSLM
ncbi:MULTISPECIES: HTH-type transcriptional activator IlvY [unclassified Halomonas]|uniref:HTH-type transcriptional activator IlvY n=1 Tax=unclassified Halomonas TaxID=2609666 RepID=UPI0007DA024A|nr:MULTISPECIES: HTH-type transcriptional activator IlvY [unclassified Halomonas]MBT2784970.1 HTH-type transcriptional activator IlvY [Halomonas sp. ISL-106]MBT2796664.1 HTH-type transcriptional activator IlvY [Halomonas sp. ISL-104]OAL59897.1 transcriptional regulator IlvY [Halomonas sp. ALS9]